MGGGADLKACPKISIKLQMPCLIKTDDFLSNTENKQEIISMLSGYLNDTGCKVFQLPTDADLLIVMNMVEMTERQTTVLTGEDTDLLVLLLYYTKQDCEPIFFDSDPKSGETGGHLWDMLTAKLKLGDTFAIKVFFLYAFLKCNLTLRICGTEKSTPLNHAKKKKNFS